MTMQIANKYSHLGAEEYLLVHHKNLYNKIVNAIDVADLESLKQSVDGFELEKEKIAIHINFDSDLSPLTVFARNLPSYWNASIDLAIEIFPTRKIQEKLPANATYYEDEVYNVVRSGRGNPPMPLLILGVE